MDKRYIQLGMNPSTAQQRLVKDTLFRLALATGHQCFRCGGELTRETFSVEHKEPWLDSGDPLGLFFDQNNIAFSHHSCNVGARRVPRIYASPQEAHAALMEQQRQRRAVSPDVYCPLKRHERYKRTGK